jgi:hypothetical protein
MVVSSVAPWCGAHYLQAAQAGWAKNVPVSFRAVSQKEIFPVPRETEMKRLLLGSTVAILTLAGCAAQQDNAVENESQYDSQAQALAQSGLEQSKIIDLLKKRIVQISKANQTRLDNIAAVESELKPLVSLLVRIAPKRTNAETAALLEGPWYSLWTNQSFGRSGINLSRIFQVVTTKGHYYNISEASIPNGPTIVGALRGAYAQLPDGFAIRFTKNGFVPGVLVGKTSADIAKLAADFESGATPINPVPGPIGVTGKLTTLYVDDSIRIAGGDQTPVFDDNGVVSVPGVYNLLFVQERLQGVVP